jgi:pimeloyl-ACP methyl ester carboxylesterase
MVLFGLVPDSANGSHAMEFHVPHPGSTSLSVPGGPLAWLRGTLVDELVANALLHGAFRFRRNPVARGPQPAPSSRLDETSRELTSFFGEAPQCHPVVADRHPRWPRRGIDSSGYVVTDHHSLSDSPYPVSGAWPEVDRVWLRRWTPTASDSGTTIVGVHGIVQRGTRWFDWMAERLCPQGHRILTVDSPFNFRRTPYGYFPGQLILGGDLEHQLAVARQAVRDTWQMVRSEQAAGRRVLLCGVSYGGWVSLLVSLLADDLAGVVVVTPPVNTLRLLREGGTLIRAVRSGLGRVPLDFEEISRRTRPLVPALWQPRLNGHRVRLHAARYDRFVKADHIAELSAAWGAPLRMWPAGHFAATMRRTIIDPVANDVLELAEG